MTREVQANWILSECDLQIPSRTLGEDIIELNTLFLNAFHHLLLLFHEADWG